MPAVITIRPVPPLNMPQFTPVQEQAIVSTRSQEPWSTYKLSKEQSIVRDLFLGWVDKQPSTILAATKTADHPFWASWRSIKSDGQTTALHYAATFAKDPSWISALVSAGVPINGMPGTSQPPCNRVFGRPIIEVCHWMEAFDQAGANWTLGPSNNTVFHQAARSGAWSAMTFLLDKGLFQTRLPRVESDLLGFKNFNGKASTLHAGEALERLWSVWGEPDTVQLREMWRSNARHHAAGTTPSAHRRDLGLDWLLSHWNPHHPGWSEDDSLHMLDLLIRSSKTDHLMALVDQGWTFSDKAWRTSEELCLQFNDPARHQAVRAAYDLQLLTREVGSSANPVAVSRRM